MPGLLSVGDLIDKLVIENIKVFDIREKLRLRTLSDEDRAQLNVAMMALVRNRGAITVALDEKIEAVLSGREANCVLKRVRTYELSSHRARPASSRSGAAGCAPTPKQKMRASLRRREPKRPGGAKP